MQRRVCLAESPPVLSYGPVRLNDGTVPTPDSAIFTIEQYPSVGAGAITIDGPYIDYTFTPAEIQLLSVASPSIDLRGIWTFTVGAHQIVRAHYFDIVEYLFETRLSSDDLERHIPELVALRHKLAGKVDKEGPPRFIAVNIQRVRTILPNYYRDSIILFTSGANKGQSRRVLGFDPVNGEIEIDDALQYAHKSGDAFELSLSWQWAVDQGWHALHQQLIRALGREASSAILSEHDLYMPHLYYSAAFAIANRANTASLLDLRRSLFSRASTEFETAIVKIRGGGEVIDAHPIRIWSRHGACAR